MRPLQDSNIFSLVYLKSIYSEALCEPQNC